MDRDLKERTKQFALRIKLYLALPSRGLTQVLGTQIL